MQPFLEIPIGIANSEGANKDTTCRFKPGSIDYYYPGFYEGTVIVLKSGQAILSKLKYDELHDALTAYKAFIDKNPGVFGNLEITAKPNPAPKSPILHVER